MGQTHSNIDNGHTERAMVEQDTMVQTKDTEKEVEKVSFNLAETSEESFSGEEESDEDFDEELEEALAERRRILEDAKELKKLARMYLHPEDKIVCNPSAFGRCYFNRVSAPEQETYEEAEARAEILADAAKLKRLAVHYMHPEIGVQTTDATACARNYFERASAPEQDTYEEGEERAQVFSDCKALLKNLESATYKHPCSGSSPSIVVRNVSPPVVKTVDTSITKNVSRSASHVKLFGLDEDMGDATY